MSKRLEHIEAAKNEAIRLGARFELLQTKKSFIGVIYINGRCRKTSFSVTPSRLANYQTVKYIRQAVREMTK